MELLDKFEELKKQDSITNNIYEVYNRWKFEISIEISKQNIKKINLIDLIENDDFCEYIYFNSKKLDEIKAILTDEEYKKRKIQYKDDLEILKIIKAREEDFDFELKIAEVICGDNQNFPYKKGYELTSFFQELGFNYTHDGSTRKLWVRDILKCFDSTQIYHVLTDGVFKWKYFVNSDKNVDIAKEELKNIIENSCKSNETIDISDVFGLNVSNEILFDKKINTKDNTLNELINTSKDFFIKGNKQFALEKIWDAFERIKTVDGIKKTQIIGKLSENGLDLNPNDLNLEFKNLTYIGDNYQIRHFETNKLPINNDNEKEYLYFRVLSLINLVISKLNIGENNESK